MGFECVVRALRSGFPVRRPQWLSDDHLEIKNIDSQQKIIRCMSDDIFHGEEEYFASSEDILATDWEKYVRREIT